MPSSSSAASGMNVTMTSGIARASGTNCARNSVRFGSRPCSRSVARRFGEFRLACLLMGQGQNADHGPAGGAGREAGRERLEGSGVGLPGKSWSRSTSPDDAIGLRFSASMTCRSSTT